MPDDRMTRPFGLPFVCTLIVALCVASPGAATAKNAMQDASSTQRGMLTADYRIGPRDVLEIRVFGLDDLDQNVRVTENGTISLPLIGEITAGGQTRTALETALEEALSRYLTDPQVTVFIREYRSQRFSVMGAIQRPGTYEMVGRKTLLEAISDAGGINLQESSGMANVLRRGFDGAPIQIDLRQLLEEGNSAFNIEILPGDTIHLLSKKRYSVYVYGQVRTPGQYELREDVTLLQAISLAGGLADRAAKTKISILRRRPDGEQEKIQVNLQDIIDGKIPDMPIRPNDVIIVPETFF